VENTMILEVLDSIQDNAPGEKGSKR